MTANYWATPWTILNIRSIDHYPSTGLVTRTQPSVFAILSDIHCTNSWPPPQSRFLLPSPSRNFKRKRGNACRAAKWPDRIASKSILSFWDMVKRRALAALARYFASLHETLQKICLPATTDLLHWASQEGISIIEARRGRRKKWHLSISPQKSSRFCIICQNNEECNRDRMANHINKWGYLSVFCLNNAKTEGSNYRTVFRTPQNDLPRIICSDLQHHRCSV